jgi:hypothetical protein
MITVYALVDPESHLVRYVGQTTDVIKRYREHCSGKSHTGDWVRSLTAPPQLVILETVSDCLVRVPGSTGKNNNKDFVKLGVSTETKWLKRFRRTVINRRMRDNSRTTWDWLVNPGSCLKVPLTSE